MPCIIPIHTLSIIYITGYEGYEQTFPEDEYRHEAGPNARVSKVYNKEAATHDTDMVRQCRDSSDVILVFVGVSSFCL